MAWLKKTRKISWIHFFLLAFLIYGMVIMVRSVRNSFFISKTDRINLIFYGQESQFVSLGVSDGVNYRAVFEADISVYAPGGYGRYRVGSLGRLAYLDKSSDLIRRAFSHMTSSYISVYFYPKRAEIYRQNNIDHEFPSIPKLSLFDAIVLKKWDSNASFFDRLYIFWYLLPKRKNDFSVLRSNFIKETKIGPVFAEEDFQKKYQGFFYQKKFRLEAKHIKIISTSYKSAAVLSGILEGEGIRVADIMKVSKSPKQCLVAEDQKHPSETAGFLIRLFECGFKTAPTGGVDIIFTFSEEIDNNWQ